MNILMIDIVAWCSLIIFFGLALLMFYFFNKGMDRAGTICSFALINYALLIFGFVVSMSIYNSLGIGYAIIPAIVFSITIIGLSCCWVYLYSKEEEKW